MTNIFFRFPRTGKEFKNRSLDGFLAVGFGGQPVIKRESFIIGFKCFTISEAKKPETTVLIWLIFIRKICIEQKGLAYFVPISVKLCLKTAVCRPAPSWLYHEGNKMLFQPTRDHNSCFWTPLHAKGGGERNVAGTYHHWRVMRDRNVRTKQWAPRGDENT